MRRTILFAIVLLLAASVSVSCVAAPAAPAPEAGLPNPASVHCEHNGGRLELRQDASGGVAGVCVFADGSECDEWAYFRGECGPGDSLATPEPGAAVSPIAAPMEVAGGDVWKLYRNEQLGYSFEHPADAVIETADDPLQTLTITGPLVGDEHWPVIYISHPSDREEYRPPEGADLAQWLTDHGLLAGGEGPAAETRLADTTMAGATAIHTRKARSPQSYAYDKYAFAVEGQLYVVVILHTGDREDWAVYDRFLKSFQLDK